MKGPKVTHRDTRGIKGNVTRILKSFEKALEAKAENMALLGKLPSKFIFTQDAEIQPALLLELRRKLRDGISESMQQKKGNELELAVWAALVWFGSLEQERQTAILETI
jgi:hypothetical protein